MRSSASFSDPKIVSLLQLARRTELVGFSKSSPTMVRKWFQLMHGLLSSATASQARIYLYSKDVDMRRSFNGLMGIEQSEFERDILEGDLFLFINKRRDRIKILWWDGDGLAIFMKRLEAGTYQRVTPQDEDESHVLMDRAQLGLLLSGIELSSVKRRKRYSQASNALAVTVVKHT